MNSVIKAVTLPLLVFTAMASPTSAQSLPREVRDLGLMFSFSKSGPAISAYRNDSGGDLKIEYIEGPSQATVSTVSPSFNWNGGLFFLPDLSNTGGELFLAGTWWNGSGSPLGVLERYTFSSSTHTFSLSGFHVIPGSDLLGVVWQPSSCHLYVLDEQQKLVLAAPYMPGNSLPTSWAPLASYAQFTPKSSLASYSLFLTAATQNIAVEAVQSTSNELLDAYEIDASTSPPTFLTSIAFDHRWARISDTFPGPIHLDSAIVVESPPAAAYAHLAPTNHVEVYDVDAGEVVGSGALHSSGESTIGLSSALELGHFYEITTDLFPGRTDVFLATKNWGVCDTLPGSWQMEPISDGYAFDCFVGSENFGIGTAITWDDSTAPPSSTQAILVVGREQDIVQVLPQRFLLTSTLQFVIQLGELHYEQLNSGLVDLPIPNDPALANGTLCFQWYLETTPNEWYASNIRGILVRSNEALAGDGSLALSGRRASSSSSASGRRAPSGTALSREQLKAWVEGNGGSDVSLIEKQLLLTNLLRR